MLDHSNNLTIWDILVKSDLLNVIILAAALIYLGNKYLPKIIETRKNQISKELKDAKESRIKAEEELEAIKQKTKQADFEINQIKEEAKKIANIIKKQVEEETQKELESIRLKIKREISSNQEEAIEQIKKSTSGAAIKLAEEMLAQISKNKEIQNELVEDFLNDLKEPSKN